MIIYYNIIVVYTYIKATLCCTSLVVVSALNCDRICDGYYYYYYYDYYYYYYYYYYDYHYYYYYYYYYYY